ncbi:MAG: hypothetical protein JXA74_06370 [Anaerolineae bacterium]|nr:hypothetical protein [Anaerolineae bacterium]
MSTSGKLLTGGVGVGVRVGVRVRVGVGVRVRVGVSIGVEVSVMVTMHVAVTVPVQVSVMNWVAVMVAVGQLVWVSVGSIGDAVSEPVAVSVALGSTPGVLRGCALSITPSVTGPSCGSHAGVALPEPGAVGRPTAADIEPAKA